MKRDFYGNAVPESVYFNLGDFQGKIRALVDFAANGCSERYQDDFLIFLEEDKMDKHKRNINFHWYCKKFMANKDEKVDDNRDHEALLGKHFKDFNLLIFKDKLSWIIQVSTPEKKPGTLLVQMRAKDPPYGV